MITFHDRVVDARRFAAPEFAGSFPQVRASLGHTDEIFAEHVSGRMNAALRGQILDGIDAATIGFVANARCLTEGVDLPDLDAVAFLGARRSKIDLLQAIGRALRKPHDRYDKIAYVFVPIVVEDGEVDIDPLVDLLSAIQEEDDEISDCVLHFSDETIDQLEHGDYENYGRSTRRVGSGGVVVLHSGRLPEHVMRKLVTGVEACVVERHAISWNDKYEKLCEYVRVHGRLPTAKVENIDWRSWLEIQRVAYRSGELPQRRVALLESLGIQWYPNEDKWERGYAELEAYVRDHHITELSNGYITDNGFSLEQWVRRQHRRYREGYLSEKRILLLERIPDWRWFTRAYCKWLIQISEVSRFCREFPGETPPPGTMSKTGVDLHAWFRTNRQMYKKGSLTGSRVEDLSSIDGWTWELDTPPTRRQSSVRVSIMDLLRKRGRKP